MTSPINENNDTVSFFESWDVLEKDLGINVKPDFIPEKYNLEEIISYVTDETKLIKANYFAGTNYIRLLIHCFDGDYGKLQIRVDKGWEIKETNNKYEIYYKDEEYLIYIYGKYMIYQIYCNEDISYLFD